MGGSGSEPPLGADEPFEEFANNDEIVAMSVGHKVLWGDMVGVEGPFLSFRCLDTGSGKVGHVNYFDPSGTRFSKTDMFPLIGTNPGDNISFYIKVLRSGGTLGGLISAHDLYSKGLLFFDDAGGGNFMVSYVHVDLVKHNLGIINNSIWNKITIAMHSINGGPGGEGEVDFYINDILLGSDVTTDSTMWMVGLWNLYLGTMVPGDVFECYIDSVEFSWIP